MKYEYKTLWVFNKSDIDLLNQLYTENWKPIMCVGLGEGFAIFTLRREKEEQSIEDWPKPNTSEDNLIYRP